MRLARWFRVAALWVAIVQAASLPVATWADALLQARARVAAASLGRSHAEPLGVHHPWHAHDASCALCSHLVAGRTPAPAPPRAPQAARRTAPAPAPHDVRSSREAHALVLPRAPPLTA